MITYKKFIENNKYHNTKISVEEYVKLRNEDGIDICDKLDIRKQGNIRDLLQDYVNSIVGKGGISVEFKEIPMIPHFSIRRSIQISGYHANKFRVLIVVDKIIDEWYILHYFIEEIKGINYGGFYKCDEYEGLLKCIKELLTTTL